MNTDFLNDVGPGWRPLVKPLLGMCKQLGVEVTQVKEKFGRLRFYVIGAEPEALEKQIEAAERLSAITCEECGDYGVARGPSWIKTYCEQHHEQRERLRRMRAEA